MIDGISLLGFTVLFFGSIGIGLQVAILFRVEDILKHLKGSRTNHGSDDIS